MSVCPRNRGAAAIVVATALALFGISEGCAGEGAGEDSRGELPRPGQLCDSCTRSADCAAALRCFDRVCQPADDWAACGGPGEGGDGGVDEEPGGPVADGEGEGEAPVEGEGERPAELTEGEGEEGPVERPEPSPGDTLELLNANRLRQSLIEPVDAALVGGLLGVCTAIRGFITYDLTDPAEPRTLGRSASRPGDGPVSHCQRVAMDADRAFVTNSGDQAAPVPYLASFDLTGGGAPVRVDVSEFPGQPLAGLALFGQHILVAAHGSGLLVLDAPQGRPPQQIGANVELEDARAVAVSGSHAFVADGDGGLAVLDLSTPSEPVVVARVDTRGTAIDVDLGGGLALVAIGDAGLAIVDIRDPVSPRLRATADTPGTAIAVAAINGHAVVADWTDLRVHDVRDPSAPIAIMSERPPPWVQPGGRDGRRGRVANRTLGLVAGGDIVVALDWHGPVIYRFHPDRVQADLQVRNPDQIFRTDGPGDLHSRSIIIENGGQLPLTFDGVDVDGIEGLEVDGLPDELDPGERAYFEVIYTQPEGAPRDAHTVAHIRSDDPDDPELPLRLFINPPGVGVGDEAPPGTFSLLGGGSLRLQDIEGPYLLAYFATY